ncbi:hypothetical protein [Arthrobacter mobilis]|uniref:Uncharacterized protein n=1 Tax=Arthrobacter mobilis TaxID=2724944 RepID=A0A7X6H9I8_9MICC|nr:hypothetical protein [Arthrobacter mobilis]NKX52963.1 hypothetical protein [Arthrobacter mobilis]
MAKGTERPHEDHNRPVPREERRDEGVGPLPVHGSASAPAMPNLAAAQIPGPGTAHIIAGETAAIPNEAADPVEKQGHQLAGRDGGRREGRWPWRLFRRRR